MDLRKLSWKKKTSEKNVAVVAASQGQESLSVQLQRQNDEQATKLEEALKSVTERDQLLEDASQQLHDLEEKNKSLNEKLSAALLEITTKENSIKQHTKVAEEAVSGWEKAGEEALIAKQQVDTLTQQVNSLSQQKAVLEDRNSHLDAALKECTRQVRNVREESERKLQDTILNKNRELEELKFEYESKIRDAEHQILQAHAENTALSRTLQERNRALAELNDARNHAEAQVNVFEVNLEQYQKENSSLMYELQVLTKSLDIRTEEKNILMKSSEAASKQQIENVKKITKLEAECQKLRGLVRKKLPGPAAMAQMRMEADYGREPADVRRRRSPARSHGSYVSSSFDPGFEYGHDHGEKESSFLSERLMAMEEETKMLKEALAKRTSELVASRSMYSKSQGRVTYLEKQLEAYSFDHKHRKPNLDMAVEVPRSHTTSNPPSLTSMSEDGNDDEVSVTESWSTASALVSGLSQIKREKLPGKSEKGVESEKMVLMDDFEEMERLASLPSAEVDSTRKTVDIVGEKSIGGGNEEVLAQKELELQAANQHCAELLEKLASLQEELMSLQIRNDSNESSLATIQEKLNSIYVAYTETNGEQKVLQLVKLAMSDSGIITSDATKPSDAISCFSDDTEKQISTQVNEDSTAEKDDAFSSDLTVQNNNKDFSMETAVSRVICLLECISREAQHSQKFPASKVHDIIVNVQTFSNTLKEFLHGKLKTLVFVNELSSLISHISEICVSAFGRSNSQNLQDQSRLTLRDPIIAGNHQNGHSNPNAAIENSNEDLIYKLQKEKGSLESELDAELRKSTTLERQLIQATKESNELRIEFTKAEEKLKQTNAQLNETENLVKHLQEELASAKESTQLSESKLESLSSQKSALESQLKRTEVEKISLHEKIESLQSHLEAEQLRFEDMEEHCKELNEELQRKEEEIASSRAMAEESAEQAREIIAAKQQLDECQRTMNILGKQFKICTSPKDLGELSSNTQNMETNSSVNMNDDWADNVSQNRVSTARYSTYSRSCSIGSEGDTSVGRNYKQKDIRTSGSNTGRHDTGSPTSHVLNDSEERHSRRPSYSDTEGESSKKSPSKLPRPKSRIPKYIGGSSLSKSLNIDDNKTSEKHSPAHTPSEKHGNVIGRLFTRRNGR